MKRVLTIAMDFPPRRTSGVYRTTNLTKYLCQYGWEPSVLTVERRPDDVEDVSLLEGFPAEIRIDRTRYWHPNGWENLAATAIRTAGVLRSTQTEVRQPRVDRMIRSWADLARSILYFPDRSIGWVPFALEEAVELHFRQRFDALYTTSPPKSGPVVGLLVKLLLGIPWVAEFRDPWYPSSRPFRRAAERWLERVILSHADAVVLISSGHAEELNRSLGVPREKMSVVSNGYDENDFHPSAVPEQHLLAPGYVHFSHFGTVYPGFSGKFFEAVAEMVRENPVLRDRLRVNVIGFPDQVVQGYAEGVLRGVVQIHSFVKHAEAIAAMRASHCLLLFLANPDVARLSGVGKIYDYLRVGRPVLAVAYPGDSQELVEEGQAGWVVNPEDSGDIKRALRAVISNARQADSPRPIRPEFVEQFRYDRLAGKVAEVLNRVAAERN